MTFYIRRNGEPDDRAMMRLAVRAGSVDEADAQGDGTIDDRVQRIETWLPIDTDLQDALATMLLTRVGWVSVLDGDRFVGIITPEAVYLALRRSLEHRDTDD